ncbi:hypothetical protein BLL52_0937 [Rhodoferax antarcticus ANT.BR]|uniref:Uncharacterized protein n=1 Tax=Rhodoferax antarcticus ANT.BR TaxID=1111071 RepID=A0A1Q8YIX2_9BURK|nr:hypothetical protein BLL52_0937 [Rhodoferax antarcticus ANT.BR]
MWRMWRVAVCQGATAQVRDALRSSANCIRAGSEKNDAHVQ